MSDNRAAARAGIKLRFSMDQLIDRTWSCPTRNKSRNVGYIRSPVRMLGCEEKRTSKSEHAVRKPRCKEEEGKKTEYRRQDSSLRPEMLIAKQIYQSGILLSE